MEECQKKAGMSTTEQWRKMINREALDVIDQMEQSECMGIKQEQ